MEFLRDSFDNLVKETLAMDPRPQSQPLSESEEYTQTVTDAEFKENSTGVLAEKCPNFSTAYKQKK